MAKNWIQIDRTEYWLKSDRLNWVVARRKKCKVTKSHPDGYKFVNETYHSTLEYAFQEVFEEIIKLADAEIIHDILQVCEETHAMLNHVLKYDFKAEKSAA